MHIYIEIFARGLALGPFRLGARNGRVVPSTLAFYDSFRSWLVPTLAFYDTVSSDFEQDLVMSTRYDYGAAASRVQKQA